MKPSALATLATLLAMPSLASAAAAPPSPSAEVPAVFAPGVVSGPANDADPCFTADGSTVIFARGNTILESHKTATGGWSKPTVAPFSGRWPDQQPTMSPDGSFLVFVSGRPTSATDKTPPAGNLSRVDRRGAGGPNQPRRCFNR